MTPEEAIPKEFMTLLHLMSTQSSFKVRNCPWKAHPDDSAAVDTGTQANDCIVHGALLQVGAMAHDGVIDLALDNLCGGEEARGGVDWLLGIVELEARGLRAIGHATAVSKVALRAGPITTAEAARWPMSQVTQALLFAGGPGCHYHIPEPLTAVPCNP